jgi:hypothetical protein
MKPPPWIWQKEPSLRLFSTHAYCSVARGLQRNCFAGAQRQHSPVSGLAYLDDAIFR